MPAVNSPIKRVFIKILLFGEVRLNLLDVVRNTEGGWRQSLL
jgi:hypothetical protein